MPCTFRIRPDGGSCRALLRDNPIPGCPAVPGSDSRKTVVVIPEACVTIGRMNIEEIERRIAGLSLDEFKALRLWFDGESRQKEVAIRPGRRGQRAREEPQRPGPLSEPGVRHRRTDHFRICCRQLPEAIRTLIDESFELLNKDSTAPSLQFQKDGLIWSMNIGTGYKALALDANGRFLWYWVGSLDECYAAAK